MKGTFINTGYVFSNDGLMRLFALIFAIALSGLALAGSCPPGMKDCFLCGGVGGIPCTTNCTGKHVPGVGNVACECPQGEPCVCHCPVGGGGSVAGVGEGGMPKAGARLTYFTGEVYVRMSGGGWARATENIPISENSAIKTGKNARATIIFDDGSKVYMDENAEIAMKELERPAGKSTLNIVVELVKAAIFSDVTRRDGTKFEVKTSVSVPAVKGTKFSVYYDDVGKQAVVKSIEGTVTVPDRYGHSVELKAGEMVAVTEKGGLGAVEKFDMEAEAGKWGVSKGGCCSSALILLLFGVLAALQRL
ncbi:MAG: FecR family protein [Candidatus Micrarchaeia archaeon]